MKLPKVKKKYVFAILVFLFAYLFSYGIIRVLKERAKLSLDNSGRQSLLYGTFWNRNNPLEIALSFFYLPLGYADFGITGHLYWLRSDPYFYCKLSSPKIKAFIANKTKTNNEASYHISYSNGKKIDGSLGYLNASFEQKAFLKPLYLLPNDLVKKQSGKCNIEVKFVTALEGKLITTMSIPFNEGVADGRCIFSFPSSEALIDFKQGSRHGIFSHKIKNIEAIKGYYDNGMRTGEWSFRNIAHPNIQYIVNYRKNILDGFFKSYDSFGDLISSGEYKDGKPYNGTFLDGLTSDNLGNMTIQYNFKLVLVEYKKGKAVNRKNVDLKIVQ